MISLLVRTFRSLVANAVHAASQTWIGGNEGSYGKNHARSPSIGFRTCVSASGSGRSRKGRKSEPPEIPRKL